MRATRLLALLGLASVGIAQTIAPSPTESIGCEPHGDHWHCEGPRPTSALGVTTTRGATTSPTTSAAHEDHEDHDDEDEDHDHDDHSSHASGTGSIKPSPTESVGCEPHGDHWHCDGPATARVTTTSPPTGATGAANSTTRTTSTVSIVNGAAGRAGFGAAAIAAVGALLAL